MAGRAKENLPGGSLKMSKRHVRILKKNVYLNVVTVRIYNHPEVDRISGISKKKRSEKNL